ncbi:helix-turn-helix domain-containing protein [Isoptericola croceus]|uniref:helix-turn-helix domain-containing protein n=1 Tax=Isoptericola croceus TaxID=3031406 RepID=UPI0023F71F72|nr:helix-turn-helix transcriptional regulator [Isoptericola croceus]
MTGSDDAHEPLLRHLMGAILRRARQRQGRTLQEVASAARMSTAYLSEVERGRKEPSSEVLAAVCRALDLRLVDLVADAHASLAAADQRVRVLTSTSPTTVRHLPATRTGAGPRTTSDVVALAA